jgi:hypothetical protein
MCLCKLQADRLGFEMTTAAREPEPPRHTQDSAFRLESFSHTAQLLPPSGPLPHSAASSAFWTSSTQRIVFRLRDFSYTAQPPNSRLLMDARRILHSAASSELEASHACEVFLTLDASHSIKASRGYKIPSHSAASHTFEVSPASEASHGFRIPLDSGFSYIQRSPTFDASQNPRLLPPQRLLADSGSSHFRGLSRTHTSPTFEIPPT